MFKLTLLPQSRSAWVAFYLCVLTLALVPMIVFLQSSIAFGLLAFVCFPIGWLGFACMALYGTLMGEVGMGFLGILVLLAIPGVFQVANCYAWAYGLPYLIQYWKRRRESRRAADLGQET